MNYLKHYIRLVKKAKRENRNKNQTYYEMHHVKPKCLGGKFLVRLTAKEHFIAHFLLYKHFNKYGNKNQKIKMSHAFAAMTSYNSNMKRYVSRSFEIAKKARSLAMSGPNNHNYGKKIRKNPMSDEERKQKSEFMKINNPSYNFTDEWRKNISNAKKGKPSNAKGNFKVPGDGKWEGTSHKGIDNPRAKVIYIFNQNNDIVYKCYGNFHKTLHENNMPSGLFRKSLGNNGEPIKPNYKHIKKERRELCKQYEGWYAKECH